MSELKFSCPDCGQKISCDADYAGRQFPCPQCQKTLTVPSAVAAGAGVAAAALAPAPAPAPAAAAWTPAPKPITQPAPRPVRPPEPVTSSAKAAGPAEATGKYSALAIASLLCSVVAFVGTIPAIIFAHMAKTRMRRDPTLKGEGMAHAGLIIGRCFLGVALVSVAAIGLVYWHFKPIQVVRETPQSLAELKPRIVDEVTPGPSGNEDSHGVEGIEMITGPFSKEFWRSAVRGGSFSYDMKVLPDKPVSLNCRYWGGEQAGRTFDIAVDNQIIATQDLTFTVPGHFFDMEYKIPARLTRGKSKVKVEFQAHPGKAAGGLFGCQILKR